MNELNFILAGFHFVIARLKKIQAREEARRAVAAARLDDARQAYLEQRELTIAKNEASWKVSHRADQLTANLESLIGE